MIGKRKKLKCELRLKEEKEGQENPMAIKEGDVVDYDGEVYTVVKICLTLGLMEALC